MRHAYEIVQPGRKVCMFLRLLFLESKGRQALFEECPLKTVYVSRKRIPAYKNNDQRFKSSAIAFCWYIRKGRVEMELNEKRYEKWVEKGLKKARSYVKEQAGNDEITDLLKRLIENAFYEGYMAAKEEKLHGKISII